MYTNKIHSCIRQKVYLIKYRSIPIIDHIAQKISKCNTGANERHGVSVTVIVILCSVVALLANTTPESLNFASPPYPHKRVGFGCSASTKPTRQSQKA